MITVQHNNTQALHNTKEPIPTTARGRALCTTAWYLNGKPGAQDYDTAVVATKGVLPC